MTRRTQDQWRELVKQQADSGQTATAFCTDHGVNAKYFSLRKQKLAQGPERKNTSFVAVKAPQMATSPIDIQMGEVVVHCPANKSAEWIAELVRALR